MKKIKDNLLSIYLIINIGLIFLTSYLSFVQTVKYGEFTNLYMVLLFVNVFVFIIALVKKKLKLRIYDFFLLLMLIFGIIATIFAIRSDVALYGFKGRYEGLISLVYYYSIFLISSCIPRKNRKIIIYTILTMGLIEFVYGILQLMQVDFVKTIIHDGMLWVTGFTYNPNFFGIIMLICLCYSLGLFIESSHLRRKIIYGVLILLFLIGLFLSNTTSCVVALIFILIYLIYYCLKNKKTNELLVVLILVVNTLFVMNQFNCTTIVDDLIKTKNETVEIAKGHVDDYYGTRRVKVWKETMKLVPKYMIHGAGIDNFFFAFGNKPLIIKYYMYDKAHNEYLQILLTEGIFALISYLLFYTSVFLIGFNNRKKYNYLLLPVMGYLIQAFFNISVVEAAPLFFMSLGFLVDRKDSTNIYKAYIKRLLDIVISLISIIILLPVFLIISILIKIDSKGTIFYKQKRTGKDGKDFNILKFRTMNNKKVTKIGKFLRNSSIDELPQLINVLKGDMSLIGPRPWVTDYYKKFNKNQKKRVSVRPGIIGLAQVNGRNNISVFEKIDYDLKYIDNISFINDLKILFKSISVIFVKENIKDMDKYINDELKELSRKNKIDN